MQNAPTVITLRDGAGVEKYFEADVTPIPVDVLMHMGQGALKVYLSGDDTQPYYEERLRWVLQGLISTTRSSGVTDRHLTAACNALCVFLESCCSSSDPRLEEIGFSEITWEQCFEAMLESFQKGKIKPTRQVLDALAKILVNNPNHVSSKAIQDQVLLRMVRIVFVGEHRQLKAGLVILDLFIRKVTRISEVLVVVDHFLDLSEVEWFRRLSMYKLKNTVPGRPISSGKSGDCRVSSSTCHSISSFIIAILIATLSRDSQSAAIALFKTVSRTINNIEEDLCVRDTNELLQSHRKARESSFDTKLSNTSFLLPLIDEFLAAQPLAIENFSDFLFPYMFKQNPSTYGEYILLLRSRSSLVLLLGVIQVGCQSGIEKDPPLALSMVYDRRTGDDECKSITSFLSHRVPEVRVRTFAILIASESTNTPLSDLTLKCLKFSFQYLYGEIDPETRGKLMSIVRKLIIRLRGGASFTHKASQKQQVSETARGSSARAFASHHDFLVWFIDFLIRELEPSASYQRHIMALRTLELLLGFRLDSTVVLTSSTDFRQDQTQWPFSLSLHQPVLIRSVLNLLLDAFEDVRSTASFFLKVVLRNNPGSISREDLQNLVKEAEILASRSHRADHADGSARFYEIYCCSGYEGFGLPTPLTFNCFVYINDILGPLEVALSKVGDQIDAPLHGINLHGRLLGLRYSLQDLGTRFNTPNDSSEAGSSLESLIDRLTRVCGQVWRMVRQRLCIDSPENSKDEVEEDGVGGPKDMLSYSWRALRDSSLLLRSILENRILTAQDFPAHSRFRCHKTVASLCFEQLRDLRHRGAFSTVAQTFSIFNQCLEDSKDLSIKSLRDSFYQKAIEAIDDQSTKLTRRSAGLPAMIAGLLTGSTQVFFNRVIQDVSEKANPVESFRNRSSENPGELLELPQVHALNCLREILMNAKFRILIEPYVLDMLNLAAKSLTSDLWAIRNCGLMLFRASTIRLSRGLTKTTDEPWEFGSRQIEPDVSVDRSKSSLEVVIKLLDPHGNFENSKIHQPSLTTESKIQLTDHDGTHSASPERVFAALNLIERLNPSVITSLNIESLVMHELGNKVWQVRAYAARIHASLVPPWLGVGTFDILVKNFPDLGENHKHGRLLSMRHILADLWRYEKSQLRKKLDYVSEALQRLSKSILQSSDIVRAAFLDVLNDIIEVDATSLEDSGHQKSHYFHLDQLIDVLKPTTDMLQPHLRQSIGYHVVLRHITRGENLYHEDPRQCVDSLVVTDIDDAAFVLRRLRRQKHWSFESRVALCEIYVHIVLNSKDEDIILEAIKGLTISIEARNGLLDSKTVIQLQRRLHHLPVYGQRLWNAKLRLQASLYSTENELMSIDKRPHELEACYFCSWASRLLEAARDETDVETRLCAVKSLKGLILTRTEVKSSTSYSSHFFRTYLVLYDLLNDDDEEVRELAGTVAARILSMELTPLAASQALVRFLTRNFASESSFIHAALEKVVFSPERIQNSSPLSKLTEMPVSMLLQQTQDDVDTLFAQEKQNLYIDEQREVKTWSTVLQEIDLSLISASILNELGVWVVSGLTTLDGVFGEQIPDGTSGVTFQVDIFLLISRVVATAGVLLQAFKQQNLRPEFQSSELMHGRAELGAALESFKVRGQRFGMHRTLVEMIDEITGSP